MILKVHRRYLSGITIPITIITIAILLLGCFFKEGEVYIGGLPITLAIGIRIAVVVVAIVAAVVWYGYLHVDFFTLYSLTASFARVITLVG